MARGVGRIKTADTPYALRHTLWESVMEHDKYYGLMMDALDGELAAGEMFELESHLRACPSCRQEWEAVLAVDTLFRQTPALSPAAGFTQRTVARLPNRKLRLWSLGLVYSALWLAGILPLLAAVALVTLLAGDSLAGFTAAAQRGLSVAALALAALGNGFGHLAGQYPAIWGLLFVMAGLVLLWNGVYRQLAQQPTRI